jgi:hypothetical protein
MKEEGEAISRGRKYREGPEREDGGYKAAESLWRYNYFQSSIKLKIVQRNLYHNLHLTLAVILKQC